MAAGVHRWRGGRGGAAPTRRALAVACAAFGFAGACRPADVAERAQVLRAPGPGVSLALARARAASIGELRYEVTLEIPAGRRQPIEGDLTVRLRLDLPAVGSDAPLVLDFTGGPEAVHRVELNGAPAVYGLRDEHLFVGPAGLRDGDNELRVRFTAGDGSLNRNDEYLYTLFVPDRARTALPVFDQPDLKARWRLTLVLPRDWQAVANGAEQERVPEGERVRVRFAETEPIASYAFAFAAGRFHLLEAERDGRKMRLLHRETDPERVARNLEAIFDLHARALAWLQEYTGIPYPFAKFDFVAVPAFQYGGMEHPGAIFYRAPSLFLPEAATQNQLLGRASVIAHETAHMWFGNLVTMRWFDDVWMKEVFANFMAAKIVNPSFPEVNHELRFLLAHYPAAYAIDRTAGANPIRQRLDNLAEAGTLYGAIIYQKAPIMMRQLELLVGEEAFRDGLRAYLDAHRYGNATWPELIELLDARSAQDLRAWSRVWVEQPGRPTVRAQVEAADDGTMSALRILQQDPAGRGRVWPQRVEALLGTADGGGSRLPALLRTAVTEVPEATGRPLPAFLVANGAGLGYGRFVLEPASRAWLEGHLPKVREPIARAAAWLSLWDAMLEAELAPDRLLELGRAALSVEADELLVQQLAGDLGTLYWRYLTPERRLAAAPALEGVLWRLLERAPSTSLRATFFRAWRDVALTDSAVARMRRVWAGRERIEGLPLSVEDTTALAQELALRGVADAEAILEAQRERIDNPDRLARFDFARPALSADRATRLAFFESLREPANREHEPWVLDGLRFLHHPLRAASAVETILPALELLPEIQRTGDIFFPLRWLNAVLGGHQSEAAAAIVRDFLEQHPELPAQLRGKLLQAADPLWRAARITRR